MEKTTTINYIKIYKDLISKKFPERIVELQHYFNKGQLSNLDIINLNKDIFGHGNRETKTFNQQHKSYDKKDILKILDYQKMYNLNNSQLANELQLSRNTIHRWKVVYQNAENPSLI